MGRSSRSSPLNRILFKKVADPEGNRGMWLINSAAPMMRSAQRLRSALGHPPRSDLETEKIVSDYHRFVCLTVPKVASTSLLELFLDDGGVRDGVRLLHCSADDIARDNRYRTYFKFAFVRNPWSRIVSCWRDKIFSVSNLGKLRIISRYSGLYPQMPFRDFLEWLCTEEGSDAVADRHWISQHRLLSDASGALVCDEVGHLETFRSDLRLFLGRTGAVLTEVPHANQGREPSDGTGYRAFFDGHSRDMVAKRYARDIELFGFAF